MTLADFLTVFVRTRPIFAVDSGEYLTGLWLMSTSKMSCYVFRKSRLAGSKIESVPRVRHVTTVLCLDHGCLSRSKPLSPAKSFRLHEQQEQSVVCIA